MPLSEKETREAVIQYAQLLPDLLKRGYGGSGYSGYTSAQIKAAIEESDLSKAHVALAVALFGNEEAVRAFRIDTSARW